MPTVKDISIFVTEGCVICEIVSLAIKDVALSFGLTLRYFGEHPDIPAYPAVLVKDRIFIGEFAAKEASLFLQTCTVLS